MGRRRRLEPGQESLHLVCGLPWTQHVPSASREGGVLCPDIQAVTFSDLDPYHEKDRPSGRPFWEEEGGEIPAWADVV